MEALRWGDPLEDVGYVMDAVRAVKPSATEPLIGFCGAPFTIMSYLIEGAGAVISSTPSRCSSPSLPCSAIAESITSLLVTYLGGQVRAGVDALQIFDSWAGALTPADYAQHVAPHVERLVREARFLGVPVIFARATHHLDAIARTEADVIGIDWSIGLDAAIERVGADRVVQGNLDPMLLLGSEEELVARTRRVVEQGRGARAHVFNLGHGISRHTDPEMARLMIDTVHEAS